MSPPFPPVSRVQPSRMIFLVPSFPQPLSAGETQHSTLHAFPLPSPTTLNSLHNHGLHDCIDHSFGQYPRLLSIAVINTVCVGEGGSNMRRKGSLGLY